MTLSSPSRAIVFGGAGLLLAGLISAALAQTPKPAASPTTAPTTKPIAFVPTAFVPADVDRDHPVYATSFDDPAELANWSLEGGQRVSIQNGNLVLESSEEKNHLVYWLKKEMPAAFCLEFTLKPQDRKKGLNIVFFSARGIGGESVFDPKLNRRDGTYKQYFDGDINAYHVSYWAAGRDIANLRKSKGFHLVATGNDLIYPFTKPGFQTVRIYKRGPEVRVAVDDVLSLTYTDDGKTFGPVLDQPGWIGLRQMGHTVRCEYGELKVFPLK